VKMMEPLWLRGKQSISRSDSEPLKSMLVSSALSTIISHGPKLSSLNLALTSRLMSTSALLILGKHRHFAMSWYAFSKLSRLMAGTQKMAHVGRCSFVQYADSRARDVFPLPPRPYIAVRAPCSPWICAWICLSCT
jgi:hypothetical protein